MATNDNFYSEMMDFTVNGSSWLSTNLETLRTSPEETNSSRKVKKKIKLSVISCIKCSDPIKEKHLYAIRENYYHKCCVRCDICKIQLDESGFLIDNTLLCKMCYNQSVHVTKCFGCKLPIKTQDVVMYAINQPYHLPCFKCNYCKKLLSKGDKFIYQNEILICEKDFESGTYLNSQLSQSPKHQPYQIDNPSDSNSIRRKTKISVQQRQYLESYYASNSNPSMKQRVYISEELNLPLKVVQTWFCNYRTKMKVQRNYDFKPLNEKLQSNDHDRFSSTKVKRMIEQQQPQQCFTPDLDGRLNCQISQSTEDHLSPQDLSSDISAGMYTCPDLGKSYHRSLHAGDSDSHNQSESIDDSGGGLTYADLSNSCVKSSIMERFSAADSSSKTCLTWS